MPSKRSRQARRAALAMHAKHGPEVTAPARAAFNRRFTRAAEDMLGPDASEAAVARTAEFLRRRYFSELAERSVEARRRRKAAK